WMDAQKRGTPRSTSQSFMATAAAVAMKDWLVDRGVPRFCASIHPRHESSRKVAASLGLRRSEQLTDEGEEVWNMTTP
ncbi:MAG TPA: GNAT family N-acetyltransferase, partial [Candidatus Stackebrandtia faecavium]|nr:GNAT family N-acetyltransferase [Candidatus Stackebrandtia faecavium]